MSFVDPIVRRAASLLTALALTLPLAGNEPPPRSGAPREKPDKPGKPAAESGTVEVHFLDDGHIKVKLRDEKIELVTPYGKLQIPTADIRRIEFATRVDDDVAR